MTLARFEICHVYGDWMRPGLAYRILPELAMKCRVSLPIYPFHGGRCEMWKDRVLDRLSACPRADTPRYPSAYSPANRRPQHVETSQGARPAGQPATPARRAAGPG
jgi:hypothetical protein